MPADRVDQDDPEEALREVRARFIAAFPGQCDSVALLLAAGGDDARQEGARHIVHRLTGLGGVVGFPSVSQRASELESLLMRQGTLDRGLAQDLLTGIREAYVADLMQPPDWAADLRASGGELRRTVLIVEDDPDQLELLEIQLQRAGYRTIAAARGDEALVLARERRPSLVLLDVDLPGMDGYAVCRALKTDPEVGSVPVVFLTTRASIDARLSGLTLGADEYLCKPVDARELLLRLSRLWQEPDAPAPAAPAAGDGILSMEAFAAVGKAVLDREAAALALIRATPDQRARLDAVCSDEARRRDTLAHDGGAHLLWLMPGVDRETAASRVRAVCDRIREGGAPAPSSGIACGAAGSNVAALISEADEALTRSLVRASDDPPLVTRTLVLADDDPDVMRVVDGYMRSAGFQTVLAFDGEKALRAVTERQPDVLILDLMMPAMSGFDVLARLKGQPHRPRIVVLSGRGREDDVTRAFELGADDYIVKPFSPQELRARILRLLK